MPPVERPVARRLNHVPLPLVGQREAQSTYVSNAFCLTGGLIVMTAIKMIAKIKE